MYVKDIVGVLVAVVVLAGLSVAIINGGQTATIIEKSGAAFVGLINAATHPGQAA